MIEAHEDKNRYVVLRKIGLSKKENLRIVIKQIGFIFIAPLIFAVINSVIALGVYVNYMIQGGGSPGYMIKCILVMMVVYITVYMFYYVISVRSYMKIIRGNTV